MAGYKNFNFMFFILYNDFYLLTLREAASLTNFRAMSIIFNKNLLAFRPVIFPNNPLAFSNKENKWSEHLFNDDFPVKNPSCFVFYESFYRDLKNLKFFQHLRDNYPDCKLVLWIINPIHVCQKVRGMFVDDADTKEILSTFDCIFTYNQVDAMDYGLTYFEGPYSVLPYEQPKEEVDIFFVGLAKNRLEKILRAYESFKAAGFICDFHIADIPNPISTNFDDLHFNRYLSYAEVLEHVLHSRAVLDIAQRGTYGLTMRYFESLAYNKNFITDNAFYRQDRFTSPKLFLIDRSLEIDKEKFMDAAKFSSNYKNEYSPLRLISFLESILNV